MCWCDANQQRQQRNAVRSLLRLRFNEMRCRLRHTPPPTARSPLAARLSSALAMPGCDKRSSLRRLVSCFWPGLNESVTTATISGPCPTRASVVLRKRCPVPAWLWLYRNFARATRGTWFISNFWATNCTTHNAQLFGSSHFECECESECRRVSSTSTSVVYSFFFGLWPTVNPFEHIYGQLPEGIQLLGESACNCY